MISVKQKFAEQKKKQHTNDVILDKNGGIAHVFFPSL